VRDPVPSFRGPELSRRDLRLRRQARLKPPGRLPQGQPDRLDIDIGVREPLGYRLERPDRPAELLAGLGVLGGQLKRPLGDSKLERAQPHGGPGGQPGRDLVSDAEQAVLAEFDAGQLKLGGTGPEHHFLPLDGHALIGELDAEHADSVSGPGRH
jgi:hypothetical protein